MREPFLFNILFAVFKKNINLALDFYRHFYILTQLALLYVKRLCFILSGVYPKKKMVGHQSLKFVFFFITIGDCQYG